jgi:hypothetical protein
MCGNPASLIEAVWTEVLEVAGKNGCASSKGANPGGGFGFRAGTGGHY